MIAPRDDPNPKLVLFTFVVIGRSTADVAINLRVDHYDQNRSIFHDLNFAFEPYHALSKSQKNITTECDDAM